MGAYIDYNDLNISVELKRYLSRSSTAGEPDRNVIDKAISQAEGMAKTRLGVTYTLPQDEADQTEYIKGVIEDIAIYRLYKNLDGISIPEKAVLAYEDAKAELDMIAKRNITLGLDTDDEKEAKTDTFSKFVRG